MAVFGGLMLTNSGRNLEAKAQLGKTLKLKRIALGDGQMTGESMLTMTKLINEVLSCEIKDIKILQNEENSNCDIVSVFFYLSNQNLDKGFTWREVGIIAEDPDTLEEILYCYGNARDNAEYICAKNEKDILEQYVSVDLIIGNEANISAVIDGSLVFVTRKELEEELENAEGSLPRRKTITLFSTAWTLNEATQKYEYRIDDTTITEDDDIDVRIEDEEQEEAFANIEPRLHSYNKYYTFTAKELIEVDIEAELVITRTKAEISDNVATEEIGAEEVQGDAMS